MGILFIIYTSWCVWEPAKRHLLYQQYNNTYIVQDSSVLSGARFIFPCMYIITANGHSHPYRLRESLSSSPPSSPPVSSNCTSSRGAKCLYRSCIWRTTWRWCHGRSSRWTGLRRFWNDLYVCIVRLRGLGSLVAVIWMGISCWWCGWCG